MKRFEVQNQRIAEVVQIDEERSLLHKEMRLNKKSLLAKAIIHIKLMMQKNFLIMKKNQKTTLFQLSSPLIVCVLLTIWQTLANNLTKITMIDNQIENVGALPKCIQGTGQLEECITIAYGVIGEKEQWIDHTLDFLALQNDLDRESDIVQLNITAPQDFSNFIKAYPNRTQVGIVFCTSNYLIIGDLSFPCNDVSKKIYNPFEQDKRIIFYNIFYNWTLFFRSPYLQGSIGQNIHKDWFLTRLKINLDNGIIDYFSKTPEQQQVKLTKNTINQRVQIVQQDYPISPSRFTTGYDVVTSNGAFYFFVPIMINFIITINEILREKQKKLRQGITVMGMTNFSYWVSWIMTALVVNSSTSFIQIVCGRLFGFDIFVKTPLIILFSFLVAFGMSVTFIGFLITNICSDTSNGYTFAYGFLLMALVMEFFLTSGFFIYYLHRLDAEFFVAAIKRIFSLYPAFHYSKMYGDIAFKSGKHYSVADSRWIDGVGYNYSDLFEPIKGKFTIPKESFYECPTTFESFIHLNLVSTLYFLLAIYCDIVFPNNRGTQESPLFFLSFEYWYKILGLKKKQEEKLQLRKTSFELRQQQKEYNYSDMNLYNTVSRERSRVQSNDKGGAEVKGMRVVGLGKIFHKYPFGIKSSKDKIALKDVYFEVDGGELIAILGHNGAGKSTMINILTGLLSASSGTANMLGFDINTQMSEIQSIMGVCPQFDILWDELTAEEHLKMYCMLKGIPVGMIPKEINTRLQEVGLFHVKKASVGTYSGGMKRRVSLAISAIGNPKIIFMDEPTTGMDPKTRREIWEMVKNLKRDKAIVLTTHAMEEAETLSDRIIVVVGGQLKCIGTSLYLKNHYSDGYRLSIVTEPQYVDYARIELKKLLPSCKIQDSSGGSIVACVPVLHLNELGNFFKIMESDGNQIEVFDQKSINFKKYVKDWGLSHSTLEEVFLKITKSKSYLV
ncbi:hypothetical protein ABPG72_011441 [Tetrahymena utriculariae]